MRRALSMAAAEMCMDVHITISSGEFRMNVHDHAKNTVLGLGNDLVRMIVRINDAERLSW
jgi:hypothetical protein